MQILTSSGSRSVKFIPREAIDVAKTYKLTIKSDSTKDTVLTDTSASFSSSTYYYTYSTTQALTAANFYVLEINNLTDSKIIFRDKIFCTDQTVTQFEITDGLFTEAPQGNNEYAYYG